MTYFKMFITDVSWRSKLIQRVYSGNNPVSAKPVKKQNKTQAQGFQSLGKQNRRWAEIWAVSEWVIVVPILPYDFVDMFVDMCESITFGKSYLKSLCIILYYPLCVSIYDSDCVKKGIKAPTFDPAFVLTGICVT